MSGHVSKDYRHGYESWSGESGETNPTMSGMWRDDKPDLLDLDLFTSLRITCDRRVAVVLHQMLTELLETETT